MTNVLLQQCFFLVAEILLVEKAIWRVWDLLRLTKWFPQRAETVLSSLSPASPQGYFTKNPHWNDLQKGKETDALLNSLLIEVMTMIVMQADGVLFVIDDSSQDT